MESPTKEPRTVTDLDLEKLKIMFGDRISPRRLACVEKKYDLLKYLWKESQIKDCYLEKYKLNNLDEISTYDDAFSRYLFSTNRTYTLDNEYAKQRLADRIEPVPQESTVYTEQSSIDRFAEKKFKIHDLIRTEIGSKWWDFGRHLRIKQGLLDTINVEQNEVARKVDKVFEAFERECYNEITYVDKVTHALSDAKRKDLARLVYEVMKH